ncbi:hypothetical protein BDA96_03G461000 [Sorghum bicolor]|uniref:Uncharacterized protein n=1 Tax=Sorghum bicolor TaxID=4558 RepID=A0A921UQT8_SORBI|nr:hypothetical protein BDA96_03G461000 [Sorghum bicolor]
MARPAEKRGGAWVGDPDARASRWCSVYLLGRSDGRGNYSLTNDRCQSAAVWSPYRVCMPPHADMWIFTIFYFFFQMYVRPRNLG